MKTLALMLLTTAVWGKEYKYLKTSIDPPPQLHKIMFIAPVHFPSHVMTVAPLAVALASRGHEVHMMCETPDTYRLPNVTCWHTDIKLLSQPEMNWYESIHDPLLYFKKGSGAILQIASDLAVSPSFIKLYEQRKSFDIIIVDHIAFMSVYPLLHGTTYGIFSTSLINQAHSASFGNLQNPAYVTSGIADYARPFSFLDRFKNFWRSLIFVAVFRLLSFSAELQMAKHFPEVPSLVEVERNASLHFITTHPALEGPLELLPTQVSVAGLVLRENQPLPKDLADFVSGDVPVIYVSFGVTFIFDTTLPSTTRDMMLAVLKKLPYKVIFKIPLQRKRVDGNVLFHNDVPQQDILAHPNVRLFVSHFGLAGTQEAVYHSVPILGLPAAPEHFKTADTLVMAGVAMKLNWADFNSRDFENAITEIMNSTKYHDKMAAMSRIYRDQPESALDRAVYWTEYVARHRGASHLQSPAKDLALVQIFCLDIIAANLVILYFIYLVIRRLFQCLVAKRARPTLKNKNKIS